MKFVSKTLGGVTAIAVLLSFTPVAFANPGSFSSPAYTAVASSTLTYMTAGTATTTVTYDTYESNGTTQVNNGNTFVADGATLLLAVSASSTSSVFVTNVEYSVDGIDWYQDNRITYAAGAIAVATPNSFTYTYASTTPGGGAVLSNSNRGAKAIRLDTPTRYVRAVISLTGTNGAVYATIIPRKQVR